MNTISRKLMPILLSALTVIVAAGCASKADKMPAPPETSMMPAAPVTSAIPAAPDTSAIPAAPDTSAMPAMPAAGTMAAMPDTAATKMEGMPDGKMPVTPGSGGAPDGKMPVTPGSGGAMPPGASDLKLDGAQEVPPVTTTATGTGSITVAADRTVSGSITTTGIEATAAHIHVGAATANGPVIIPLKKGADDNSWVVPPKAKLTAKQLASYKAGNLYVNVHSAANPKGEIRVQLVPQ